MQLVSDVIKSRGTYWVRAGASVREVVHYLCEKKTGAVVVMEGGQVAGLFSERDLMHRVVDAYLDLDAVQVGQVMTHDPVSVRMDDTLHHAKGVMLQCGVRHLVVEDSRGVYQGLISMRDLIEADVAESSELIERLNDVYYEKAYRARWRVSSNRIIVEEYPPQ